MTHRNTAGKMAVRLNIIRADQEPEQLIDHNAAPWPNNYFTLVWTETGKACLYVHDEVTKGGVLLACTDAYDPPSYCITGLTLGEDNVLTLEQEGDCPDQTVDLSRFIQTLAEYTVVEFEPGHFAFEKDGVRIETWWEGGFTERNEDGSVTVTNPDGSTVVIPAPLSPEAITLTYNMNQTVCLNVGDQEIGCWQQGDVVGEDTDIGVHYARKPDGTLVTWKGTDHITTASMNAVERSVTIVNPDGQTITFPYGQEIPPFPDVPDIEIAQETGSTTITLDGTDYDIKQTHVTRGAGNREAMQTLTADHQGTWPNTQWRETWMERVGNIVIIHSWNPVTNDWDAVAVEAPENVVVLNNPVIYVRKDTGQANPPINVQADLTVANAFDNMGSVRAFMNRVLLVGTVTIDIRGDYTVAPVSALGQIGPSQFKNAQTINLRGDPADPSAVKIPWGSIANTYGATINGGTINLRDMTFVCQDTITTAQSSVSAAIVTQAPANVQLAGTVVFDGVFTQTRPQAPAGMCTYLSASSSLRLSDNSRIVMDMTGNIRSVFTGTVQYNYTVLGNVTLEIREALELQSSVFDFAASSTGTFSTSVSAPNTLAIAGPAKFIAPYSVRVYPLATVGSASYGNRPTFLAYDFGAVVAAGGAQAVFSVDPIGVVMNVAGP